MQSDTISLAGEPRFRRRRLSFVWDNTHENPEAREEGESEGSSAGSVVGEVPEFDEVVEEPVLFSPVNLDVRARNVAMVMASLDGVNFAEIFKQRARVMRTVPLFLLGKRNAPETGTTTTETRELGNCFFSPRMLLSRPPRGGRVPRKQLEERFQKFSAGQWADLIEASTSLSTRGSEAAVRRRRGDQADNVSKRADRALELVQMGELSAGRLALEGAQIAPGDDATFKALTDATRRPPVPRAPLSQSHKKNSSWTKIGLCSMCGVPGEVLQQGLPACWQIICSRCWTPPETRRSSSSSHQCWLAETLPLPQWKPSGWAGSHGIIVGDVLRRLVARTMAKQMTVRVEAATAPFQYALTTKAGCESVAHILQSMTDEGKRATIVSIDGVGAYDLISRNARLEGLVQEATGCCLLCVISMGRPPRTCGRMTVERRT